MFLLSVFILWFSYYVSDIFYKILGSWMTTCLGKSCSFGLPRVPFVNCCQFMYLVISLLVLRAGCGIWLYQFLIIAYLFTFCARWKAIFLLNRYSLIMFWIILFRHSIHDRFAFKQFSIEINSYFDKSNCIMFTFSAFVLCILFLYNSYMYFV